MIRVSVIIPVFNERENLPELRTRLEQVFRSWPDVTPEYVLVDDHSTDGSEALLEAWSRESPAAMWIRFARNFGSHAAVSAGFATCTGDCAIILAADLQDPPELIPDLVAKWKEGNDVVWAARTERPGETRSTRAFAQVYYALMRRLAFPNLPEQGADCVLIGRPVIAAYVAIPERNTNLLGMILWLGFKQTVIPYAKQPRKLGHSKWTLKRKVKLLVDSVVSFSDLPIRCISMVGLCITALGISAALVLAVLALVGPDVAGWGVVLCAVLTLGGLHLVALGILGEYLWRAVDQGRGRPRYVIERRSDTAPPPQGGNG